jgi:hypothetical protein
MRNSAGRFVASHRHASRLICGQCFLRDLARQLKCPDSLFSLGLFAAVTLGFLNCERGVTRRLRAKVHRRSLQTVDTVPLTTR